VSGERDRRVLKPSRSIAHKAPPGTANSPGRGGDPPRFFRLGYGQRERDVYSGRTRLYLFEESVIQGKQDINKGAIRGQEVA
jgi:hypothetical protein